MGNTNWITNLDDSATARQIASEMWTQDLIADYEIRNRDTDEEDVRITREDGQVLSLTTFDDEYGCAICWTIFDQDGDDSNTIVEDGGEFAESLQAISDWAAGEKDGWLNK